MKYVILVVALLMMSTVKVTAQDQAESCRTASDISRQVALWRDQGIDPNLSFYAMLNLGLPPQVAISVVDYIYRMYADRSPDEVKEQVLTSCLGEPM